MECQCGQSLIDVTFMLYIVVTVVKARIFVSSYGTGQEKNTVLRIGSLIGSQDLSVAIVAILCVDWAQLPAGPRV